MLTARRGATSRFLIYILILIYINEKDKRLDTIKDKSKSMEHKHLYHYFFLFLCSLLPQVTQAQDGAATNVNHTPEKVVIENVELINSNKLDFSPAFYNDGVVFVSNRKRPKSARKITDNTDEWLGDNFMSLYYATQTPDGLLENPQEFSVNITTRYHEGPVAFSKDGNEIFFTRNNYQNGEKKTNRKGDTLLKIYTATRNGGDWVGIKELAFNSDDYDQCHPTLSADGQVLYFSSNKEGGYGGMDLYKSQFLNGRWSTPTNLGPTINTAKNEVFPFIHQNGTLYFASNGHGGYGGLDVLSSVQSEGDWRTPVNAKSPINSLYDDFGFILDQNSATGYFSSSRPKGNGKDDIYRFSLGIPMVKETAIETAKEASKIIAGVITDATSGSRLMKAKVSLVNPNNGQKMTTLTDDQGEFAFRRTMLQDGHRLEISKTGFSELTESIAVNQLLKDGSDIKEYFLLLKPKMAPPTPPSTPVKEKVTPSTKTFPPPSVPINKPSTDVLIPKSGNTVTYEEGMKPELKVGTTLVLDKILFDYGSYNLQPAALRTLDQITSLLNQSPDMGIELSAHTDSRGNANYNERLSKQRAESVSQYLIYKGISPRRIIPVGSGESEIRNGCVDGVACSESQHQENRRIEMKMIRFVN